MNATERRIKRRRRRHFVLSLAGALVFLTYMARAFFGDSGILVGLQVKSEYEKQTLRNAALSEQNHALAQEIRQLQTNPRKLEAIGRAEFGFGRPGEIVFRFPDREHEENSNHE